MIIELDGEIHQFQQKQDKKREQHLREMGYNLIRFHNQEILYNLHNDLISLEHFIVGLEEQKNNAFTP